MLRPVPNDKVARPLPPEYTRPAGAHGRTAAVLLTAFLTATGHAENDNGNNRESVASAAVELGNATRALKADLLAAATEAARKEQPPAAGRWTVYVTGGPVTDFTLRRIVLRVNDDVVADHRYRSEERTALAENGAHRLHLGTLPPGQHRIAAEMHGRTGGQNYRRIQTFTVDKSGGESQLMELRLRETVPAEKDGKAGPGLVARSLVPDSP